jgi:predicted porin
MKKSLLVLAALGAFAGAASAQSSVTLFGILDVGARYTKNGDQKLKTLSTDGINSSRLGFRGVEDLGGGLKAGFWLESAVNPDAGTANSTRFWHRRSTVSLSGGWGELRLGRDYTPQFWNLTVFDPFGTNGVGTESWYSPATMSTSGKLTDAALIRTRTSPGPTDGDGRSASSTTSGGPWARQTAARTVSGPSTRGLASPRTPWRPRGRPRC